MTPQQGVGPHNDGAARGAVGPGTIGLKSPPARRCGCPRCGPSCAAPKGTPLFDLKQPHALCLIVVLLLAPGRPPQAMVGALDRSERTVCAGQPKAGRPWERVPQGRGEPPATGGPAGGQGPGGSRLPLRPRSPQPASAPAGGGCARPRWQPALPTPAGAARRGGPPRWCRRRMWPPSGADASQNRHLRWLWWGHEGHPGIVGRYRCIRCQFNINFGLCLLDAANWNATLPPSMSGCPPLPATPAP